MVKLTMPALLQAGIHFGHRARFWNPKMAPFIFGERHGIHIINLEKTLPRLRNALQFVYSIAEKRGKILFVGTKHAARDVVREQATRCGMPYVDYRWLGGMLTNYKTIRQSIRRLGDLEATIGNEKLVAGLTKKEVLNMMREKDKLANCLDGIKNMGGLPDAIFVIDVKHEVIAIREAKRLNIPVIGIVDTNSAPEGIDHMIPGNDDAIRAIQLYCESMADAIIEARAVVAEQDAAEAAKKPEVKEKAEPKKAVKKPVAEKTEASSEEKVEASAETKEPAEKAPAKKKVTRVKSGSVKAKSTAEKAEPAATNSAEAKPAAKKATTKKTTTKKATAKKTTTTADKTADDAAAE